ncbi:hypothetical protein VPH35_057001 [Triticum aestivum]
MWVFSLLVLLAFSSYSYHYCKKHIIKYLGDSFPKLSSKCCGIVCLLIDLHAICEKFTIKDLLWIDLEKWATVTHVCGNSLLPGTICAGYVVPRYGHEPPPTEDSV